MQSLLFRSWSEEVPKKDFFSYSMISLYVQRRKLHGMDIQIRSENVIVSCCWTLTWNSYRFGTFRMLCYSLPSLKLATVLLHQKSWNCGIESSCKFETVVCFRRKYLIQNKCMFIDNTKWVLLGFWTWTMFS